MELPKNPLVPNGGLIQHELNGGHALKKHVGKTPDELKLRFKKDPHIRGSSSFENLMDAEKYVSQTLTSNKAKINDWLKNTKKPELKMTQEFSRKVGVTVKPDMSVHDANKVLVVLRRDIKSSESYIVHTAFPFLD